MSNFVEKLGLGSKGLNARKEITTSLVSNDEITSVSGARQPNGWKVNIHKFVTGEDCKTLFKLYEDVYTHPPPNNDYLSVFLRSWLVQRKGL
jgi:hypothetical protein